MIKLFFQYLHYSPPPSDQGNQPRLDPERATAVNDWGGGTKHPLVFIPPWHYFPSPTLFPYIPHLYTYTFSISWGSIIYYSDTLGLLQFCGSSRNAGSFCSSTFLYLYRCSFHLVQTLINKDKEATKNNKIKKNKKM